MLIALLAFIMTLLFSYRLYALLTATYRIEREGIRLRWGWVREDLPMDHILGVQRHKTLGTRLPLPAIRLPGSILGVRKDAALGEIEFLAADSRDLVLIVTEQKAFAISPENVEAFLQVFQHFAEMGTLAPFEVQSVTSRQVLARLWADKIARALLGAMLLGSLLFFGWVEWQFGRNSYLETQAQKPAMNGALFPGRQWRLLPWINAFILVLNFLSGITIMIWKKERTIYAYLIWIIGLITTVLFFYATVIWLE